MQQPFNIHSRTIDVFINVFGAPLTHTHTPHHSSDMLVLTSYLFIICVHIVNKVPFSIVSRTYDVPISYIILNFLEFWNLCLMKGNSDEQI